MITEKQKMMTGQLYKDSDPELVAERRRAQQLVDEFNATRDDAVIKDLEHLAWCVRYLGKRGSFVQLLSVRRADYSLVSDDKCYARRADLMTADRDWPARFIQRPADDLGPQADFDRISVATSKKVRAGGVADIATSSKFDRYVGLPFILPLHLHRSGRSFAHYVRTNGDSGET